MTNGLNIPIENIQTQENNTYSSQVFLTDDQRKELENKLYDDITRALNDQDELITKVEEWKKAYFLEPESTEKVSPWEGASNYRDMLISNNLKIIEASIINSMVFFPVWITTLPFDKEFERFLDEGLNFYADTYIEISDILNTAIKLSIQESTTFVEVYDVVENFKKKQKFEFLKIDEFYLQFPDYKKAGLNNEKEYKDLEKKVAKEIETIGSSILEAEIPVFNNAIKSKVFNIDETLIIPFNANNIDTSTGVFFLIKVTDGDLKQYIKSPKGVDPYFNIEAVEKTLEYKPNLSEENETDYEERQNERMGVDALEEHVRNVYKGYYKYTKDEDIGEEEFYIYFAYNEKQILRIEKAERIDNERPITVFKPIEIHNEIFGRCIVDDLLPTSDMTSTLWNMLIDNLGIGNKTVYTADLEEKNNPDSSLGRGGDNMDLFPGKLFYLKNPAALKQLQHYPMDIPSILNALSFLYRNAETNTGATQLLSRKESATDPNAPGNKTAMMINQANMRMNEYIKSYRKSLKRLGKHILHKCINNQPLGWKKFQIKFNRENKDIPETNVIFTPQEIINKKIVIDVRGQSVEYNRFTLAMEVRQLLQIALSNPYIAQNLKAVEVLYSKLFSFYNLRPTEIQAILEPIREAIKMIEIQKQFSQMQAENIPPPPPPPDLLGFQSQAQRQGQLRQTEQGNAQGPTRRQNQ